MPMPTRLPAWLRRIFSDTRRAIVGVVVLAVIPLLGASILGWLPELGSLLERRAPIWISIASSLTLLVLVLLLFRWRERNMQAPQLEHAQGRGPDQLVIERYLLDKSTGFPIDPRSQRLICPVCLQETPSVIMNLDETEDSWWCPSGQSTHFFRLKKNLLLRPK